MNEVITQEPITRICDRCGNELHITDFMKTKFGTYMKVCRRCRTKRLRDNIEAKKNIVRPGGEKETYSDPEFDNMSMGDVVRLMGRAAKWLTARGCKIKLSGEYKQQIVRKLKFK